LAVRVFSEARSCSLPDLLSVSSLSISRFEFLEPFDCALAMSRDDFAEVSFRFFPRLSRLLNCLLCQPGGFFFCGFGGFRCLFFERFSSVDLAVANAREAIAMEVRSERSL